VGTVIVTGHFKKELANDNLAMGDVLTVCRSGTIIQSPEKDLKTGQWKYRIEGWNVDRRKLAVVFGFRPDSTVMITVFERKS